MVITAHLVEAGFFRRLAWETIARAGTPRRLLVGLVAVCGTLSALFVNDTVCVMFTPLVVAVVDEAELPALPYLLAVASASNVGGVATYTGNPQNMIIGTHAGISFGRYFAHLAPVALLGLLADGALLLAMFRGELPRGPLRGRAGEPPAVDGRLVAKGLAALGVALVGFFAGRSLSGTALAAAALLMLVAGRSPKRALARVDYALLVFFAALFVVVAGVARTGALDTAQGWFMARLDSGRPERQLASFAAVTVLGSNVFSNVPWVLLGLGSVPHLHDPTRGWMVLAMASTLAGNLTIFGSVANLIVLELAGRHGRVGFFRFLRYGAVITLVTTGIGLAVILGEARLGW
jgi:Na+/H+ antiporter NhaD/arsenite permease-like protein